MFVSTLSCPHWDPCHTQVPTPWTGCHTVIPACDILASLEATALRQLRCLCGPNPTMGGEGRVLIPGPMVAGRGSQGGAPWVLGAPGYVGFGGG